MPVGAAIASVAMMMASVAAAATVADGRAEYDLNHVAQAEAIYSKIANDPAAPAREKAAAERELGRIAWLIDADASRSLKHLDAALAIGDKPCASAALKARVLRESRRFDEAIGSSTTLLSACNDPAQRDTIRTHLIGAKLDLAERDPARRVALLSEAKADGEQFSPDSDVQAARVRLETALRTDDAPAALAAWKDYFWLEDTDAPQAIESWGATSIFANGLRPDATPDQRLRLAELLVRTGFAQPSERFAAQHDLGKFEAGNATWARLQAYWREREKLEATLLRINRNLARGKGDKGETASAAKDFTIALMKAAGTTGDPQEALLKYYGIKGTVGTTNGYPSMHGGHVIEDRHETVSQYGHRAKVHFMALDNMLANGFTSWLWDGGAMVGGWTADGTIIHVRSAYVHSPLQSFQETQDTEARRTLVETANRLAADDIAKLRRRPVATLEGLNSRLQLQVVDRVAAVAHSKSRDDAGFRRAFLAEYSRGNLDQSIFKHEGRHAIDETLGITASPVLEYQAKLSELGLADYPRMALRNMNSTLEGDGSHDVAGAKIFDQFRRWMEAHPERIMDYDPAVPALAQLDKLSDGQIREIARSLDPLPNGRPSPTKLSDLP